MFDPRRFTGMLLLLLAAAIGLSAQGSAAAGKRAAGDEAVTAAALAGSKVDPAAYQRGGELFRSNCGGCHGPAARGGPGAPDLVRSLLVLDDEKGILIAPVLRNGRPDQGMPRPNLTEAQIADIVAWLHVLTYAADHRTTYAFQDVLTGDARKGEAYFQATCAACHSAAGDLKGIGSRYDAFTLQARWLQPGGALRRQDAPGAARQGRGTTTVTVTLASGETISGTLERVDDFNVSLRDSAGAYHSFTRQGAAPKVEVHDPLQPHLQLLERYTDADIHNVTAYLVTLK